LVDKNFEVSTAYDAVMRLGLLKLIRRTVVGIGRDGTVVFYERGTPTTGEILDAVAPGPESRQER
jgi:peroxiredoxin